MTGWLHLLRWDLLLLDHFHRLLYFCWFALFNSRFLMRLFLHRSWLLIFFLNLFLRLSQLLRGRLLGCTSSGIRRLLILLSSCLLTLWLSLLLTLYKWDLWLNITKALSMVLTTASTREESVNVYDIFQETPFGWGLGLGFCLKSLCWFLLQDGAGTNWRWHL